MKKIERFYVADSNICTVYKKDLNELEQQRDEAVGALIEHAIHYENVTSLVPKKTVFIIEIITGQTWEEIKAGKHE